MNTDLYTHDASTVSCRLNAWALWKMDSGLALGYPSKSAFTILRVDCQRIEDHNISVDPECLETNAAVDNLPYVHNVVIRVEYLSGYKDIAVKAYKCGISKRTYYNYLDHAKQLVANNLNLVLHNVHECDINVLCG